MILILLFIWLNAIRSLCCAPHHVLEHIQHWSSDCSTNLLPAVPAWACLVPDWISVYRILTLSFQLCSCTSERVSCRRLCEQLCEPLCEPLLKCSDLILKLADLSPERSVRFSFCFEYSRQICNSVGLLITTRWLNGIHGDTHGGTRARRVAKVAVVHLFGELPPMWVHTVSVVGFSVAIEDLGGNILQIGKRGSSSFVVGNVELENLAISCGVPVILEGIR